MAWNRKGPTGIEVGPNSDEENPQPSLRNPVIGGIGKVDRNFIAETGFFFPQGVVPLQPAKVLIPINVFGYRKTGIG